MTITPVVSNVEFNSVAEDGKKFALLKTILNDRKQRQLITGYEFSSALQEHAV